MKNYFKLKRILDLFFSMMLFVILLPVMLLIAIVLKCESRGEIIFKQKRLGFKGEVFTIYKFRTMVADAEKTGTGVFTFEGDPRITSFGSILRKTSLDELPQLFNILKGEMSFIGPRPPVTYYPYEYQEYSNEQKKRFTVVPGLTGYAQVIGRNTIDWEERIVLDTQYVEQMSLVFDFKILMKTLLVFANKNSIYNNK